MKSIILIIFLSHNIACYSQTAIDKTILIRPGQSLVMNFDDPEIKVSTWDKNEISIKGTVSINHGENDSAFELQVSNDAQAVTITSTLKDKENLPKHTVIKKNDKEYFFKSSNMNDPEIQKFLEENGHDYSYMSNGIVKEIKLEVFVPKNTATRIEAKYGLVKVNNFAAPLTVSSKYGGVDATIVAAVTGQLIARSQHGEVLTNLGVKFEEKKSMERNKGNNWTEISAKLGSGPDYSIESKYGNVYLRKGN